MLSSQSFSEVDQYGKYRRDTCRMRFPLFSLLTSPDHADEAAIMAEDKRAMLSDKTTGWADGEELSIREHLEKMKPRIELIQSTDPSLGYLERTSGISKVTHDGQDCLINYLLFEPRKDRVSASSNTVYNPYTGEFVSSTRSIRMLQAGDKLFAYGRSSGLLVGPLLSPRSTLRCCFGWLQEQRFLASKEDLLCCCELTNTPELRPSANNLSPAWGILMLLVEDTNLLVYGL
jgi:hypothetical protein